MRLRLLVLMALLTACSGSSSPSVPGSSSGGATSASPGAGTGSTTGAGSTSGGSSTGSTTAGTSSGSGSGSTSSSSGSTGANPTCPFSERWDGAGCAPSKEASISITEYDYRLSDAGIDDRFVSSASALTFRYADAGPVATYVPGSGGCTTSVTWLADAGSASGVWADAEPFAGDWGQLSISGTALGTITLDVDAGTGFRTSSAGGQVLLTGGEHLTFTATGGADFPALSTSVQAPQRLVVGSAPLVRGQPYTVSWTGASPSSITFWGAAFGSGGYWSFSCTVPDTGSFTLDASSTAQIPADATYGYVRIMRGTYLQLFPSAPFVVEDVGVWWDSESELEVR